MGSKPAIFSGDIRWSSLSSKLLSFEQEEKRKKIPNRKETMLFITTKLPNKNRYQILYAEGVFNHYKNSRFLTRGAFCHQHGQVLG